METKQDVIQALNNLKADFEKRESELRSKIENFDKPKNIMDIVKSYEDACKIENIRPLKIEDFYFLPKEQQIKMFCEHKLTTVIKTLNQDWIKDFNNPNEYYYVPYFDLSNYSFSYYDYYGWSTFSDVGFGWGFKNKELMMHCVKYFLNEYKGYITGTY